MAELLRACFGSFNTYLRPTVARETPLWGGWNHEMLCRGSYSHCALTDNWPSGRSESQHSDQATVVCTVQPQIPTPYFSVPPIPTGEYWPIPSRSNNIATACGLSPRTHAVYSPHVNFGRIGRHCKSTKKGRRRSMLD